MASSAGQAPEPAAAGAAAEQDNPLVSLICNIVLPALILTKLSRPERLGPMVALGVALLFPLAFFIYDFARRRQANFIAVIGFISILVTGSFGLLQVEGRWFAFKEAAMPALMGIAVVASLKTKKPLVKTLLYNERVIDTHKVEQELVARGNMEAFNRLLVSTTWILAMSFLVSAGLNFTLSSFIITSPAGSVEFNQQLGKMTAVSYGVVVLPLMVVTLGALWRLIAGIKKLTGLDLESIFKNPPEKKAK